MCLNIHTLKVEIPEEWEDFHNKIGRLEKLKKLDVKPFVTLSELKEVRLIALRIMSTLLTSS